MGLNIGLKVVKPDFKPNEVQHPTFRDRFFSELKKLATRRSTDTSLIVRSIGC